MQVEYRFLLVYVKNGNSIMASEAVYYSLLLMPPNGNIEQAFGYTPAEVLAFWEANHLTSEALAAHSSIDTLTLETVELCMTTGARFAIYWVVFADGEASRYIINQLLKQIPTQALRWLASIGALDSLIAQQNACKIGVTPFLPSPAIPSSVQPPTQPENFSLNVVLPIGAIAGGCPAGVVATSTLSLGVIRLDSELTTGGTCNEVDVV
jgi:hypothetical protein